MVDHRLLLITSEGAVIISNPVDGEVCFLSLLECKEITGVDLGSAREMNYEPDNNFYFDATNPFANLASCPVFKFENLIDNVPLYKQRQQEAGV